MVIKNLIFLVFYIFLKTGMILFNLSRDKIPYQVFNNSVFFAHKKKLKHYDLKTKEETLLKDLDYTEQS